MTARPKLTNPSPRIHYIFTPNPDISITTAILTIITCIAAVGFLTVALTALNKFFSPDTGAGSTPETMALCLSVIVFAFGWLMRFFASVRWHLAPGLLMRHEYRA